MRFRFNNIQSRTEPSLETWLTKRTKTGMPIVPANMDTVLDENLARIIAKNGGLPIFHRFTSLEKQLEWVREFPDRCYVSAGFQERAKLGPLFEAGARGVCIDVAHGHSNVMIDFIKWVKAEFPTKEVIAGNVCTPLGYQDLVEAGADCVKVGVGPGAACTTRIVTGFGVPQFTAIFQVSQVARSMKVPFIADGGIRNSRDVVLALAAGATTVMVGNLFAKTYESAAPKYMRIRNEPGSASAFEMVHPLYFNKPIDIIHQGTRYSFELGKSSPADLPFACDIFAHFRGQASQDFQRDFYGGVKKGTVAEGVNFTTRASGPAQLLIDTLLGGLRSGMTYGGGRTIKELQRKAEFVKVSSNYARESYPRVDQ